MVNYQVGIDIGRCSCKLLAIICIPGFLWDTVYMYMVQNDNSHWAQGGLSTILVHSLQC